ncbi:MAG TPA: hypothetical protein VMU81_11300 [Acetobacteraceae bacterium]|nr:hypothetical protein [Acetobacteraceae bacterium]
MPIKLLHNLRFAPSLSRAWSDALRPFSALHFGFGRLVVETAPYIVNAWQRLVWRMCALRESGPARKYQHTKRDSQHNSGCQASRRLPQRLAFSWFPTEYGEHDHFSRTYGGLHSAGQ